MHAIECVISGSPDIGQRTGQARPITSQPPSGVPRARDSTGPGAVQATPRRTLRTPRAVRSAYKRVLPRPNAANCRSKPIGMITYTGPYMNKTCDRCGPPRWAPSLGRGDRDNGGRWETIRHALDSNARTLRLCLIWLMASAAPVAAAVVAVLIHHMLLCGCASRAAADGAGSCVVMAPARLDFGWRGGCPDSRAGWPRRAGGLSPRRRHISGG
jgi:hypothetical protein